jgi:cytosine deaminase
MQTLPRPVRLLRGATLPDGRVVDVTISGGRVSRVVPAGAAAADQMPAHTATLHPAAVDPGTLDPAAVLELDGFLLLPAPVEPHAHLDKARSWDLIHPPMGDLPGAIEAWRAHSVDMSVASIVDRARAQALAMLANGTTAVRSHVDALVGPAPLRGAQALVQVRAELAGLMDIELVALAAPDTPDTVVEEMLDLGIDLVGGAPHLAPDPAGDLRRLLAIADRHGVGVDLHTDESLAGELTLADYAVLVRDWPPGRPRTAGHCVRLGTLAAADLDGVLEAVAAADIGVVTLPMTNLYLQGWAHPVSTPRGLTAVRALLDRGIRLGAGADNVRDPFNPLGRSDALETAALLVIAAHLTVDEAYDAVSTGARSVLGLPPAGPAVGARADLLAVRGASLGEVVAGAPADRYVIHDGQLVAYGEERRAVAAPATLVPTTGALPPWGGRVLAPEEVVIP